MTTSSRESTVSQPRRLLRTVPPETREGMMIALNSERSTARCKFICNRTLHGMDEDEATLDILYDGGAELSTLFRYCWAASLDRPAIYGKYLVGIRDGAAILYWQDAALYDEVWGDLIPGELKRDAEKIYTEWVKFQARSDRISQPGNNMYTSDRDPFVPYHKKKRWGMDRT